MTAKRLPGLLLAAALPLLLIAPWTTGVQAQPNTKAEPDVPVPLGKRCIVSVVSFLEATPVNAGTINTSTKTAAPTVAEGNLIRMDSEWIVLRDGTNDHWISTSKVTIMTVSN